MRRLSIGTRIFLAFGMVMIFMVVLAGSGLWAINSLASTATGPLARSAKIEQLAQMARAEGLELRRFEKEFFLDMGAARTQEESIVKWRAALGRLTGALDDLGGIADVTQHQVVVEVRSDVAAYAAGFAEVRELVAAGQIKTPQEGNAAIARFKDHIRKIDETLDGLAAASTRERGGLEKAMSTVAGSLTIVVAAVSLALLICAALSGVLLRRKVVPPLRELTRLAERMADGETDIEVSYRGGDELGVFADAFRRSIATVRAVTGEMRNLIDATSRGQLEVQADAGSFKGAYAELVAGMNTMLETLRRPIRFIGSSSISLASSAQELTAVSGVMGATAMETSEKAGMASAASEQVSRTSQAGAVAVEQMHASIGEISRNASEAARVASSAVDVATETSSSIARLGESTVEIGQVVKVIHGIAQQTNLLALNATIEAARAGDAGKGFSVVASEVKELAKATAKATEDISGKIEAIQGDTRAAVQAIARISEVIGQINDISSTISGAVEEQRATTADIGRNFAESARGSADIAQNLSMVATSARAAVDGVGQTRTAAAELVRMSGDLRQVLARFGI